MSNNLGDLNKALFMQLNRLQNTDVKSEHIELEIERTKGIALLSREVLSNANTVLKAEALAREYQGKALPLMLGSGETK